MNACDLTQLETLAKAAANGNRSGVMAMLPPRFSGPGAQLSAALTPQVVLDLIAAARSGQAAPSAPAAAPAAKTVNPDAIIDREHLARAMDAAVAAGLIPAQVSVTSAPGCWDAVLHVLQYALGARSDLPTARWQDKRGL